MAKNKSRNRTELGKELAKLRIDFNETSKEMAAKLGMSSSNLFNIETGACEVAYDFITKVAGMYGKNLEPIWISGGGLAKVTIELGELTEAQREVAIGLWRISQGIETDDTYSEDEVSEIVNELSDEPVPEPEAEPQEHTYTPKPPPIPDDVGFLSDDELDELDAL